jgi:hypothetical protein
MRSALVVYESMFGSTREVAGAVAAGLGESFDVTVTEVAEAPQQLPGDVALLVVGGPTHAFGMSRPRTRQSAAEQGADPGPSGHGGIREWIGGLSADEGTVTATFDTKVASPHLPGSAARAAQRKLHRRGLAPAAHPETFLVNGTKGGLVDGELDRARLWGSGLARKVATVR